MPSLSAAGASLTPVAFISKWSRNTQNEKQAAQSHFIDLCRLLRHPTPAEYDPTGELFAFEKKATTIADKTSRGYADVWKKDFFTWEYKSRGGDLDKAHWQLMGYAPALGNPPLQVVCDFARFRIHTAWTNTTVETYELSLDDFLKPDRLELLRNVFFDPDKLKPVRKRDALTKEAADKFATIAFRLQGRGTTEEIAHFVNQLVFCFFADSVGLLKKGLWSDLLETAGKSPDRAKSLFEDLFAKMRKGGLFGATEIYHFNGGLFDGQPVFALKADEIDLLRVANALDWSQIDPSIFGSLFERFLDPQKRAQIGAHYTDAEKIKKIIEPVILRPLRGEWLEAKANIMALLDRKVKPPLRQQKPTSRKKPTRMTPKEAAEERRAAFLERLKNIRILDPACGSGNFLYLALQGVKDIEHEVNIESEKLGLKPQLPFIGPEILKGIEINPVAAELARTTIWIGDLQWQIRNGLHPDRRPLLEKLNAIECSDALVTKKEDGTYEEARWPDAEFVVGNPPFLGGKLLRSGLGSEAVERLFSIYNNRVPREGDLVTYWFAKSGEAVELGRSRRVGLVATNSIRGGANRRLLDRIFGRARVFEAWSDEPWIVDGAAVRVSLVCFSNDSDPAHLDGLPVAAINANLTSGATDLTKAVRLSENRSIAYMGDTKGGAFDIPGDVARDWLKLPANPNGRSNADVLRPWMNGMDITRRWSGKWIVDFGWEMSEAQAALYEVPFQYVLEHVKPIRAQNRRDTYKRFWWRHVEPRPAMLKRLKKLERFIVTPTVAKHRLFSWLESSVSPDHQLIAIARDDDTTFGILHSRFHEAWSLRLGTWLGVGNDPRYTPTTTFETFPFPEGLAPNIPATKYKSDPRAIAIAKSAKRLDDLRNAWLNPPDLVDIVPEVVPGYPDRILPKNEKAAAELKKRTLTNLYNARPQWLADAHRDLDAAVAAAYGWPVDISEDDALAELLELNLSRAAADALKSESGDDEVE